MKTPKGLGEVVMYLDFDGVLHHEDVWWHPRRGAYIKAQGYLLFEHVSLLEEALLPFPEVRIVLSTSWVRSRRFSRALERLPTTLQRRVVGATFHSKMNPESFQLLPRGVQVQNDVHRRAPREWVALDDDAEGWPPHLMHKLVRTDGVLGISAPGVLNELNGQLQRICAHP
jgi:hypothetical protein